MDDIVSAAPLALDDQKKRHSDDSERISSTDSSTIAMVPSQRSVSIKQLNTTTTVTTNSKIVDTSIDSQHLSVTSPNDIVNTEWSYYTTTTISASSTNSNDSSSSNNNKEIQPIPWKKGVTTTCTQITITSTPTTSCNRTE
jgi:hypothetical protein